MADNSPNKQAGKPMVGDFRDPLLQINFDDPQKKKDKEYGKTILSRIYREQNNTSSVMFFGGRNIRWMENWQWAMGRQNMKEFQDFVSTDGNKAYTNVDMTQNMTGPQFVGTLVNSMSQNEEYPCVTAIDDGSVSEKLQRKLDALFRMREAATIDELQQIAGIQLEPADAFVPNDELSAEVYFKLEDRLPKEIEFEEILEKVMNDNEYKPKSRATKRDLIVLNCAATKIEKDDNGFISIRKVIPANLVYNFFMSDSGKTELSYIGELYSLKIKDLRNKYGYSDTNKNGLSEKEIFDIAKNAKQSNNSNRFYFNWSDSLAYAIDRPYDDYSVDVFDCEIQTFDADYYVSKPDKFGKENIQPKKGIPKPENENATIIKKNKLTWYRGIWAVKADKMIYWGLPDIVIKPFMDISQSLSSYSIQIPNNDGDYVPSLFERAIEPLRQYTLCKLKLKQLIASMAPAGYSVDVERIRDIDLGSGNSIPPLEILKIRNQTGVVLWSSRGVDPNEPNQGPPIQGLANSESVQQLSELASIMDRSIMEIRSLLGVPQYRDGSDLGERTAAKLAEGQNASSFNVTQFVDFSDNDLWQETLYKICLLKWDDAVVKNNRTELLDTVFQVKVELKPTAYEKQMLEQNIQIAMKTVDGNGKPLLSFKDAFKIRNIANYKLAELYLANMIETNEKRHIEESERLQAQNAKVQQESAQAASKQAAKLQQDQLAAEKEMEEFKSTKAKELKLLEGFMAVAAKDESKEMIKMLLPAIQQLVPNITIPLMQENKQMTEQIQAEAQEEMMEQQMQQQQGGGQMMPQGQGEEMPEEEMDEIQMP